MAAASHCPSVRPTSQENNLGWHFALRAKRHPLITRALSAPKLNPNTMKLNILRPRSRQLALKLRILLHKCRILLHYADVALYNLRVARLNRLCQRYNRTKGLNVFPVLHPTLKLNRKVNDVFDIAHN